MAKPFTLSTKRQGGNYYVQFALPDGGRTFQKSTGTPIRKETEKIAMEWLVNGNIPDRINSSVLSEQQINLDKLALLNNLRSYDFNDEDITKILKILKDRKYIISALRTSSKGNLLISDFLSTFWDYEKSPYVKESMADGKSISVSYCKTCESRVKNYWIPAFKDKYVGEITTADIKSVLANPEIQKLAPKTVNGIIDSITIAMRWASNEGYTENICYEGLRRKTVKSKEKNILTMEQANALFEADWGSDSSRLANKVAMHTGMRTGEIAALRVKDILEDCILVRSSWSRYVGRKTCKNGDEREIPIPISKELRAELLIQAKMNPLYDGDESLIFFGKDPSKPENDKTWNKYLRRALKEINHPDPESICFYSWRHFFCSRMLDEITDKRIVMKLSGHKSPTMIDHYGKHLEEEKTLEIVRGAMTRVFSKETTEDNDSFVYEL